MIAPSVRCDDIADALRRILCAEISCDDDTDELVLDTPYVVGNGYSLRAYVRPAGKVVVVSDGGFATRRIEGLTGGTSSLRSRYQELQRIAMTTGLQWNGGQFWYEAGTVEDVVLRLKLLAQAMNEAYYLVAPATPRSDRSLVERLGHELTERGLKAQENATILVPNRADAVRVDLEVTRGTRHAAIEVLGGLTENGALSSLNQAITNFHALTNGHYAGALVGVFDNKSAASRRRFREQFLSAKPAGAILVPSDEAAHRIVEEIAA